MRHSVLLILASLSAAHVNCQGCRNYILDVVILMDRAMTNTPSNVISAKWNATVDFTLALINSFTVSPDITRLGFNTFDPDGVSNIRMNVFNEDWNERVSIHKTIGPSSADANFAFGFYFINNILAEAFGARPGVRKIFVVITDGTDDNLLWGKSVLDYVNVMHNAHQIEIFVVAVAMYGTDVKLHDIASTPLNSHYLAQSDISQLDRTLDQLINNMNCSGLATLPPTSTVKTPTSTLTRPTAGPYTGCRNTTLDLVLLLDEHVSTGSQYNDSRSCMIGFGTGIARAFNVTPDQTRLGLIKFSSVVVFNLFMNRYEVDKVGLMQDLRATEFDGAFAVALATTRYSFFNSENGARPGVRKVVVVITDRTDQSHTAKKLEDASAMRAAGIEIFVVGVGPFVDATPELRDIASTPQDSHYFLAPDTRNYGHVLTDLLETMCTGKNRSAQTTTVIPAMTKTTSQAVTRPTTNSLTTAAETRISSSILHYDDYFTSSVPLTDSNTQNNSALFVTTGCLVVAVVVIVVVVWRSCRRRLTAVERFSQQLKTEPIYDDAEGSPRKPQQDVEQEQEYAEIFPLSSDLPTSSQVSAAIDDVSHQEPPTYEKIQLDTSEPQSAPNVYQQLHPYATMI